MNVTWDEVDVVWPKVHGYVDKRVTKNATRNQTIVEGASSSEVARKQDRAGFQKAVMHIKKHPAFDAVDEQNNTAMFADDGLIKDELMQKLDSAFQILLSQIAGTVEKSRRQLAQSLAGGDVPNPASELPMAMYTLPNSGLGGAQNVEGGDANSVPESSFAATSWKQPQQRWLSRHAESYIEAEKDINDIRPAHSAPDASALTGYKSIKLDAAFSSVFHASCDLEKPQYHVEDHYSNHGICQAVARNAIFTNVTFLVVFLNAIYIGVDADWNHATNLYNSHPLFIIGDNIFCVYFTGELLIRLLAFRHTWDCLRDGWFRFDLVLVLLMCIETWIYAPLSHFITQSRPSVLPVEPIRSFRLLRLTRISRLARRVPEMVTITKSLFVGMRAVLSCILFIFTLTYTFAIILHTVLGEQAQINERFKRTFGRNFDSVGDCMWTLTIDGTLLLDTHELLTDLMFGNEWHSFVACVVFFLFILLSSITMMNMLVGILFEVVSNVAKYERKEQATLLVKETILKELRRCDDGDGKISKSELLAVMNDSESRRVMQRLNIDRLYLIEIQAMMFPTGQDAKIDIKTVMELIMMCRGDLHCTVAHMANAQASLLCMLNDLTIHLEHRIAAQCVPIARLVRALEMRTR